MHLKFKYTLIKSLYYKQYRTGTDSEMNLSVFLGGEGFSLRLVDPSGFCSLVKFDVEFFINPDKNN